jgi:hypothetical protein
MINCGPLTFPLQIYSLYNFLHKIAKPHVFLIQVENKIKRFIKNSSKDKETIAFKL